LKKAEVKKQLIVIGIQLEKVKSEERSSRSSLLSRNETIVEKISRWKRSFPEQNEKICEKSHDSQSHGTPDDMNNFHNHENQNCAENNEDLHQLVKSCMTLENFGSPKKKDQLLNKWRSQLLKLETTMKSVCFMVSLMLCRITKPSLINASDVPKEKYQKSKWRTDTWIRDKRECRENYKRF
jgi:hypothetical protein